ncbi:MAG: nucleoside recognition domain-containing protein [Bacilli bacterium]
MKKKLSNMIIIFILLYIGFEILVESKSIMESINFSIMIWKNNVFPSLFPFFVLSEILINYGFIEMLSKLLKPFMRLFKVNSNCAFIFVMGLVTGFPSSAKYTKELFNKGLIDEKDATKILTFTHFSNPLFILGTISLIFLNNKEVGILILFIHYFTNILIGLLFRNYYPSKNNNIIFSNYINNKSFGKIITSSIINSINTLLLILGTITVFLVLTTIIDNNINLNNFNQSILNGFIEMTQGLKYVSLLDIPLKLKTILSTMIISFGGMSVHLQIISIISDTKIKYLPFLTARIIHALISGILIYILFDWYILLI